VRRPLDTGLLVLRVGAGLSLLVLFGIPKLGDAFAYLHTHQWQFVDFNRHVGLPAPVLVAFIQTVNESLGALLVAIGWWQRWAAGLLFIGFTAATACSLKAHEQAWLMAAYFALMFGALALTGPGAFSLDAWRERQGAHHPA
jgi:uncharacterized membrane protein YphA (DoxX/SURF4 family)